jgi:arginine N-succinyltransferase
MWVVRAITHQDIDALYMLAQSLGVGMTTMPANREALAQKVDRAVSSFAGQQCGADAQYLLVLEDTESGVLLGVSAVYPKIGVPFGFFSYHVDRHVQHSAQVGISIDCSVLNISNEYTGMTEIGTLAVRPDLRNGGAGRILARARYMLMACFRELFAENVIAEMRGYQDENGGSPFWSAVGQRIFGIDFATADRISAVQGAEWIRDLMPRFALYLDLLPDSARACVGKPHKTSEIAMNMLMKEGFKYQNYVDIFDAGPQVISPLARIKTVAQSQIVIASNHCLSFELDSKSLICTTALDNFRLVLANGHIESGELSAPAYVFSALQIAPGASVCVA